jgi:hypothetical protein
MMADTAKTKTVMALAGHHPAVHLEGVERHRQVQHVGEEAEHRGHREGLLALGQGAREHVIRLIRQEGQDFHWPPSYPRPWRRP